ncbi:MAG TPA: phospholipase C, phosphocholine-specific, partial [Streptosporangiaceae bacterium]|nr:phospholipase C, phosphocholine-specific [Streptosporangiaceae bacterium]
DLEVASMSDLSRRGFIGGAAAIAGAAAVSGEASSAEAETNQPHGGGQKGPRPRHGDIRDIKHVVVVMQENRSFDHYFGSMRGVRGFGDRSTILLPGGNSVFQQPDTPTVGAGTQYPWKLSGTDEWKGAVPPSAELGAANYGGTDHSWLTQHGAWYGGLMNGWIQAKAGPTTMGFLTRSDLPFHYALADAYTVGDDYHCSVISATGPNRIYLMSGTINADQSHPGYHGTAPHVAYDGGGNLQRNFLTWQSYVETLQNAGVSWRTYHCADDYGDNAPPYFATFAKMDPTQTDPATGKPGVPDPSDPLYSGGVANITTDTGVQTQNADNIAAALKADVLSGHLPQVSYVVDNQFFSEHPVTAPGNGAYFLRAVIEAIGADPDVFNSTLIIVNYDENDGQFDHVPPPVPAAGEKDEFVSGTDLSQYGLTAPAPVGLGFRVPLILVSPWTRGGWVTSETADHTSVIQFLEQWTTALGQPAISPNVSAWRRQVCGDLTEAFDFKKPVFGLPDLPTTGPLVAETEYVPRPDDNVLPSQEPGTKPARPLPVQPNANLTGFSTAAGVALAKLALSNNGPHTRKASHFAVYNNRAGVPSLADYPAKFPGQYTVEPSRSVWNRSTAATAPVGATAGDSRYDITVVGPNRFLRRFTGDTAAAGARLSARIDYFEGSFDRDPRLLLALVNEGSAAVTFTVTANAYRHDRPRTYRVPAHRTVIHTADPLHSAGGWYDLTVTASTDSTWSARYTGHLENGTPTITGA